MKKYFSFLTALIVLIFSSLNIQSCSSNEDTVSCFPEVQINVAINLSLPYYYELNQVGGWKYIDEQESGTRGLIIVRAGANLFKVYDRNAPHICPDSDTTLKVVDNIKIVCPKDNAEWMLLTGQPLSVSPISPKTYPYQYNSATNILSIYY